MGWAAVDCDGVATGSAAAVLGAKRLILAPLEGERWWNLCSPTWKPAFLGLGCRLLQIHGLVARDKRDMQTD